MGGTYEGLQAHLPRKARCEAYKVANGFPNVLQLKLHPRSDVWPEEFNRLCPTVDDIALYFLPGDNERFRKAYHLLSNVLMTRDSAIQSTLKDGYELLIFSSKQLSPTHSQRLNQQFFLWGVLQSVGKYSFSSQALIRDRRKKLSSELCDFDYSSNNDSMNIIKGVDSMAVKMETDMMGENNGERIDKAALSNSYCGEKKRKVGGTEGLLLTPKSELHDEFNSPPGFMRTNTINSCAPSPHLLLEVPSGFARPNTTDGVATSPALLLETHLGLTPKVEQPGEFDAPPGLMTPIATSAALLSRSLPGFKRPNTNDGHAISSALLLEASPGFSTSLKPNERGDSSNETNQKFKVSDTMNAISPWSSKTKRSARGTATSKYLHDSSFQPQKPSKVTETAEQAELLLRYHQCSKMDPAEWNHQPERLQSIAPSMIDLLSPQHFQQLKIDGAFKVRDGLSSCTLSMLLRLLSSHGTTCIGLGHPNFGFILGADGKATTLDDKLETLEDVKIYDFGGGAFQMCGASAGIKSICDRVAAKVHQLIQEAGNQVDKIRFLCEKLREEKGNWEYIFVGKEKKGNKFVPFLFTVEEGVSTYGGEYYCAGTGGRYAKDILKLIKSVAQLTLEEAVAWVERALLYGAINDHCSGGKYCIKIVMADKDTTIDSKFILTDLWDNHFSFFEDRYNSLGDKDEISKRVMEFSRLTEETKKNWMEGEDISDKPCAWKDMAFAKTEKVQEIAVAPDDDGSDGDGWKDADNDALLELLAESGDDESSHEEEEDQPPAKKTKTR